MRVVTVKKLSNYWKCYLLVAVPLILVLVFSYFPIFNGFVHVFYRWNGDRIEEFIGLDNIYKMLHDADLLRSFGVIVIFVLANLVKMIPSIIAAVVLHHIISGRWQYIYRVCFVIPMIIPMVVIILLWKYFYEPNNGILNQILRGTGFLGPTEIISWLSDSKLVIPSLIFQGFPWVGAFGVLIYLAGLQNIPKEVYESAQLDGAGPLRMFFKIELPLITTQIRINLVLMIISTLQGWEFVYLFLGESGGPNGIATVPGLYIFREAFKLGFFGYGCAVGFLLFLIILALTWVNNRYVRIEK
ncbi:MAG: sugar ABC transporter permease [Planctomycetota bacterium]